METIIKQNQISLWNDFVHSIRDIFFLQGEHDEWTFITRVFFFRNRTYISIWAKLCSKRRNILYFDTLKRYHRCSRNDREYRGD